MTTYDEARVILDKLGIGKFNLYKCDCPKIDDLTDTEILKDAGYL